MEIEPAYEPEEELCGEETRLKYRLRLVESNLTRGKQLYIPRAL